MAMSGDIDKYDGTCTYREMLQKLNNSRHDIEETYRMIQMYPTVMNDDIKIKHGEYISDMVFDVDEM